MDENEIQALLEKARKVTERARRVAEGLDYALEIYAPDDPRLNLMYKEQKPIRELAAQIQDTHDYLKSAPLDSGESTKKLRQKFLKELNENLANLEEKLADANKRFLEVSSLQKKQLGFAISVEEKLKQLDPQNPALRELRERIGDFRSGRVKRLGGASVMRYFYLNRVAVKAAGLARDIEAKRAREPARQPPQAVNSAAITDTLAKGRRLVEESLSHYRPRVKEHPDTLLMTSQRELIEDRIDSIREMPPRQRLLKREELRRLNLQLKVINETIGTEAPRVTGTAKGTYDVHGRVSKRFMLLGEKRQAPAANAPVVKADPEQEARRLMDGLKAGGDRHGVIELTTALTTLGVARKSGDPKGIHWAEGQLALAVARAKEPRMRTEEKLAEIPAAPLQDLEEHLRQISEEHGKAEAKATQRSNMAVEEYAAWRAASRRLVDLRAELAAHPENQRLQKEASRLAVETARLEHAWDRLQPLANMAVHDSNRLLRAKQTLEKKVAEERAARRGLTPEMVDKMRGEAGRRARFYGRHAPPGVRSAQAEIRPVGIRGPALQTALMKRRVRGRR